jgi:hypothetical protein
VDDEDFGCLETKLFRLTEVSANGIGEEILFRHDEQDRPGAEFSISLVVFLPTLHSSLDPVTILLADVLSGDVVGVLCWLFGVIFPGDDNWRLDNTVLDRLGQRGSHTVHGKYMPFWSLGVAEKSSQSTSPCGRARCIPSRD